MNNLEMLELVIAHLSEFADDVYVKNLKKLVRDSEYNHLEPVLDRIIEYHENNGIFPSAKYFETKWEVEIGDKEFLIEYASEIIAKLRTSIVYNQVKDLVDTDEPNGSLLHKIQECLYKYTPEKVNENFDEENIADSLRKSLQKKKERGAGLLTYTSIDKYTFGCPYGATTVIGAKAKTGKSNIAMSIAWGAITKQEKKGIYISLEIAADTIYQRLMSRYLYDKGILIDNKDIIKGTLSEKDEKTYLKYLDEFERDIKGKLCVVTQENLPELNKAELETFLIKKDTEMGGIDFVIVDQVSLLKYFSGITTTSGKDKSFDIINAYIRYFTVASYTLFQKPVAVVLLSQIKRESYATIDAKKPVSLDCFAEASEIERSCNIAVVLRSDEQLKQSNLVEMVLVVNRDGDNCEEYTPNIFIPKHCYLSSFGNAEQAEVSTQDVSSQDTSSLFKFMEDSANEDIDKLFD